MELMTAITAVSETLKITKELRQIDDKVAVAELKLRLVDIVDGLLEAKEALQDAKERERQLQAEIESLKDLLNSRGRYEDEGGCLYELDEDGKRKGVPFCDLCFVREDKLYRLKYHAGSEHTRPSYWCDNCRTDHDV